MRRTLLLACAMIASWTASVQAIDEGGTQSVFVLGAGARSLAMGRTGAALADDANALFWNAARLGALQQTELSLFRTKLFDDDILYHAGFLAYPTLDFGTFAVGYQRLDVSAIERRGPNNESLGSFDNSESNLLVGYGRPIGSGVSLGGALRLAQQSVDAASDVGFGLDIGAAYERSLGPSDAHRFMLGANLRHALEPRVRLEADEVVEPRSLKLGAALQRRVQGSRLGWSMAADVDLPRDAATRLGAGAEIVYAGALALRGGVDDGHATFGFGLAWRNVSVDYALRTDGELSRNDRFTLALRLGRPVDLRREDRRSEREGEVMDQLAGLLRERETRERARTLVEADSAFAVRDYEGALKLYRRVLTFEPDSTVQRRAERAELGVALKTAGESLIAGEAAQAATAYQAILARWPQQPDAVDGLQRAREQLARSADRNRQVNDLLREAMTRLTKDDLVGAESMLGELLRLEPAQPLAHELLGRVRSARSTRGEEELQEARRLAASGDQAGALEHLASARELLGNSAEIAGLGREWETARRRRMAAAQAKSTEDAAPRPPTTPTPAVRSSLSPADRRQLDRRYQEGLQAFQVGEFDAAIAAWRAVWALDPQFEKVSEYLVKAYLYQGIASYSSGRYEEALDLCRKVLEIDPRNEKAQRYLARIREEKRELEQIEGGSR